MDGRRPARWSSVLGSRCLMAWLTSVLKSAVLAVLALLAGATAAHAQQNPPLSGVRMIDLDGRAVRVQAIGLQDRRPGAPVVVFEAGATNSLEVWGGITDQVAS